MEKRTDRKNQNIELGKVVWLRDYEQALERAKLKNKPILLFFQEIPGCHTCVNFGREVLSHPLMVEFIESEFIPLAIYNNKPGKDSDVLKLYNERAWNNPVAHYIDARGKDIIPRLANNYEPLGMYEKLVEALKAVGKPIPKYAELLGEDLRMQYGQLQSVIYETPCFWSGETSMALHPAVQYTEAGWIGGAEVVKVFFSPDKAAPMEIESYAINEGFFTIGNHHNYKIDKRPQYYLSRSPFRYLPLSRTQRSRINMAIPYQRQPEQYLSPKQLALYQDFLKGVRSGKISHYEKDIEKSWEWDL